MSFSPLMQLVVSAVFALLLLLCVLPSSPVCGQTPLTVHLVPHTHDDVGWQITVDEYYDREVRNILNTVIEQLSLNPARRFIYVEQAFFQRWWREATDDQKALARKFVSNGQLEFINGGWCMHDEASTHYVDMIDQTTLGHRYITQQFGVQPNVTWQIDPFGHSATQATLFGGLSGIDAVFFARIDYQDKVVRAAAKELEMVWRSSPSLGTTAQTFAGAFANGFGYGAPSGFSWDSARATQIQNNKSLPGYNLDTFVDNFVSTAQRQAAETQGNHVMWTLGGDFNFQNAANWFPNLDKLIDGVNADGRMKTLYSTPSIYLKAKHDEGLKWPLKTDDFFPYADGADAYWTGYFTSRAALKRYVRFISPYLQVARHWEVFVGGNGSNTQNLWEAQGVAQHHDGVSGTAKQAVTYDYAQRLSVGYDLTDAWLGTLLGQVLSRTQASAPVFASCSLLNQSICSVTQSNTQLVVLLYNALGRNHTQRVTVPWSQTGGVTVMDGSGKAVPSQVIAPMRTLATTADSAPFEVNFFPTVAGLGFATYFITQSTPSQADPATPSDIPSHSPHGITEADSHRHARKPLSVEGESAPAVSISNEYWTLSFDGTTGLLSSVSGASGSIPLVQNFLYYNSYQGGGQDSGAYIFRPDVSNATAIPITTAVANVSVITGPLVQEVRQVFSPWLSQVVRLKSMSSVIEFEWTVGHIPVDDKQGKEVISRFTSPISSAATWYTDSNGREFLQRRRNSRPTWKWNATEITAGNYYPCNAMAWLADSSLGMAVLNDRSQGCSSLRDGELEFMIHRRLLKDDGRGVGEPLNEPGTDGEGLTVTGTHYLILEATPQLAAAARVAAARTFAPLQAFYAPLNGSVQDYIANHMINASVLLNPLPPNVEVLTLQTHDTEKGVVLFRVAHQFGVGEDARWSQPVQLDLSQLFIRQFASIAELSLTANQAKGAHKGYMWTTQSKEATAGSGEGRQAVFDSFNITLGPAEIRTFNLTLSQVNGESKLWWASA